MSLADQLLDQMFHGVLDSGHVVHFVPGDLTSVLHGGSPYAYTVGRTMVERPEFLVTGLPIDVAGAVLNALVSSDGPGPDGPGPEQLAGSYRTLDLDGSRMTVKLIRADVTPLLGARAFFGHHKVVAVQALWANADGSYPAFDTATQAQPVHQWGRTPLVTEDPYADWEDN